MTQFQFVQKAYVGVLVSSINFSLFLVDNYPSLTMTTTLAAREVISMKDDRATENSVQKNLIALNTVM